jgi:hypothetical protein
MSASSTGENREETNIWAIGERKQQTPIFQGRSVRNEDIENVGDPVHANPIEDLSSGVGLHIVASRHHDQTNDRTGNHEHEALQTAEDVHELGDRQFDDAGDETRDDAGRRCERVFLEVARDERQCSAGNLLSQTVDEEDDEDSSVVVSGKIIEAFEKLHTMHKQR